ncbi:hypothetical protein ACFWBN_16970 [Streptomyces sp. NPDC059989]|uniref:hypothetical protein n=1 Tax=Streptomyces sp. NPDC059989 TaxID=3347026 RepID=UPI0036AB02FD
MPDVKSNATPSTPNRPALAALLPLAVIPLGLTPMCADRFGTTVSIALVVASLVLVATAGGLLARTVARNAATRPCDGTQDVPDVPDVPDTLDSFSGARR